MRKVSNAFRLLALLPVITVAVLVSFILRPAATIKWLKNGGGYPSPAEIERSETQTNRPDSGGGKDV